MNKQRTSARTSGGYNQFMSFLQSIKVSEKFGHLHAIAKGYEQGMYLLNLCQKLKKNKRILIG